MPKGPDPSTPRREYLAREDQWRRCRDAYAGEDAVKARGTAYLPPLDSHERDPRLYAAYIKRALFYNAFGRTVDGLAGAILQQPPRLKLPSIVEDDARDVTLTDVPFEALARDVLRDILMVGRVGILIEMAERPYWCVYDAEAIINWRTEMIDGDQTLTRVVLAEQEEEQDPDNPFATRFVPQIRVLELLNKQYQVTRYRKIDGKWVAVDEMPLVPSARGTPLDYIPFAFVGASSSAPCPEKPPLLDLVSVNLSHYRTSADLEHGRHYLAIPMLVIIGQQLGDQTGGKGPVEVGSGVALSLEVGGDAKIISASLELAALERADADKRRMMATLGARLLEEQASAQETATAVSMRHAGEHATLRTIAETVEKVLEQCWRWHSRWAGVPEGAAEVAVELNKNFFAAPMAPDELRSLVQAFQAGAFGFDTLYANLQRGQIARPGITAEQERATIRDEDPGLDVESGDEPAAGPGMMAGDVVMQDEGPYKMVRRKGKFVVIKADTGEVVKAHDTKDMAMKHLAALRANVKDY